MTAGPDQPVPRLLGVEQMLRDIAARLAPRFTGTFTHATVERYVRESYQDLAATAKIPAVLPALAYVRNPDVHPALPAQVLFVCDHNAARSQMAAALLALRAPGRVQVRSAGTRPAADLELAVVQAMDEIGADLSAEYPKPLTDEFVQAAAIVVTVGCGDACPVLPGKKYHDWTVPDPAGKSPTEIRRIRDEIDLLVNDLLHDLT
jgi:arsenate reductase (thioredoxin)